MVVEKNVGLTERFFDNHYKTPPPIKRRGFSTSTCSLIFLQNSGFTLILHESEAFICKALKDEVIVNYASALITQQMEVSGSPIG